MNQLHQRRNPREGLVVDAAEPDPVEAFEQRTSRYGPLIFLAGLVLFTIAMYYVSVWLGYMPSIQVVNSTRKSYHGNVMCGPRADQPDQLSGKAPQSADIFYNRYRRIQPLEPHESVSFKLPGRFATNENACYFVYAPTHAFPKRVTLEDIQVWLALTANRGQNAQPLKDDEFYALAIKQDLEVIRLRD